MLVKTLAEKLTTEFASLTSALDFDIVVTDDIQIYDNAMKLGDKSYIPAVITINTSFKDENLYLEVFQYQIKFAVNKDYRDDFQDVLDSFRDSQVNETYDSQYISKTTQHQSFLEETTTKGNDYLIYSIVLNWTFADAFVGRDASFYIKAESESTYISIPFVQYIPTHDITYVSNQESGSSYRLTNDFVVLQLPLIFSNSKILELYNQTNSNNYNAVYDLKIVTGSIETIKQLVLKKSILTVSKDSGLVIMQLTFETHYPRETITLDGDSIPIVAFSSNKKKVIDTDNRYNDNEDKAYGIATSFVRSWNIKFVKNATTAWTKLETDHNGSDLDTPYVLVVGSDTYNVISGESTESFTETGDIAIEVAFTEVRV